MGYFTIVTIVRLARRPDVVRAMGSVVGVLTIVGASVMGPIHRDLYLGQGYVGLYVDLCKRG